LIIALFYSTDKLDEKLLMLADKTIEKLHYKQTQDDKNAAEECQTNTLCFITCFQQVK